MDENTTTGAIDVVGAYACPVDPFEAMMCDSCQ